jgi:hypothetical protein
VRESTTRPGDPGGTSHAAHRPPPTPQFRRLTFTCTMSTLNVFVGRDHVVNSGNPNFPDGVYPGDRVCYEIDHWTAASANPPDASEISSYDFPGA